MNRFTNNFRDHARAHLALGLPLIGSNVAQVLVQMTDTLMLGWYGVEDLAAVALAGQVFFVLTVFGLGISFAVMPMVAAASEAGDDTRVRRVTRMGLWGTLLVWALAFPVLWFSEPVLLALGQSDVVAGLAQDYLRIMAVGMAPVMMVMVLKNYLAALEHTRVQLYVTLVAAVLNAGLNWVLIFGRFGLPELGVQGAAIASVTLQAATLVVLAVYAARNFPAHGLFQRLWRPDWEALREVLASGWRVGVTLVAEIGMFTMSSIIMGMIGTLQLAAHGIALQIVTIFFMVHVGLSSAATVRAGRAKGREDGEALRDGARAVLILSMSYALVAVSAFLLLPEAMMSIFIDPSDPLRPEIVATGAVLLAVAAIFQLFDAAQAMAMGLLRGLMDIRVPMYMAGLSYWLVGIPLSWVFGVRLEMGGPGVWAGLVVGLTLAAILMMTRFWRLARQVPAAA